MFLQRLYVTILTSQSETPCPVKWLDSFCMRNFTNDPVFDDTLPLADGLLEAGLRVPLPLLQLRMADWFRRKAYLQQDDELRIHLLNAKEVDNATIPTHLPGHQ